MLFNPLYIFPLLAITAWVFVNSRLSWELLAWGPENWLGKLGLLALLWLVPLLGTVVIYRRLGLKWFKAKPGQGTGDVIGGGLVELDMMFNPGAKHLLDAKQPQQVEMQQDGEPDDRQFDHIDVTGKSTGRKVTKGK